MSELRSIEIPGGDILPAGSVDAGAVPELRWVRISDLRIDEAYQRHLKNENWRVIRRIAREFAWSKFSPVIVAPIVGGAYAVVDGQHRAHAALLAGFDEVPAQIVVLAGPDQAGAFAAINSVRTAVTPLQVFRAARAAAAPWAMACIAAVEAAGCELMDFQPSAKTRKARQVWCVSFIRSHVDQGRGDLITRVLASLATLPAAASDHFDFPVLAGLVGALVDLGDAAGPVDLARYVAVHDPVETLYAAERMRARDEYRGQPRARLYRAILVAQLKRFGGEVTA